MPPLCRLCFSLHFFHRLAQLGPHMAQATPVRIAGIPTPIPVPSPTFASCERPSPLGFSPEAVVVEVVTEAVVDVLDVVLDGYHTC